MTDKGEGVERKPYQVRTVHGEPYRVGERKLIPVARIASYGRAKATVGTNKIGGWAWGLSRITPMAIVEETPEGEQRIPIVDITQKALGAMLMAAVAYTLLFTAIRWIARNQRCSKD